METSQQIDETCVAGSNENTPVSSGGKIKVFYLCLCLLFIFTYSIRYFQPLRNTPLVLANIMDGEDISENGWYSMTHETFNTVYKGKEIVNHDWLYCWMVYVIYRFSGYDGLRWFSFVLGLGLNILVTAYLFRREQYTHIALFLMLLAICYPSFYLRASTFSMLLFAVNWVLLQTEFEDEITVRTVLLAGVIVLINVIWINSHSSYFFGLFFFTVLLMLHKKFKRLPLIFIPLLINPFPVKLIRNFLHHIIRKGPSIDEWQNWFVSYLHLKYIQGFCFLLVLAILFILVIRKQITSRAALFTMVILVPVLILSTLAAIRNRLYLVYMTPLIFALDEKDIFSKDKSIPIGTVMVLIGMVFSLLAFDSNWIITNITYTERESVQNFIRAHKLFGNYLTIYPDDGTLLNMEKVTTFTNARINVFIDEEISAEIHETWFKDFLGPLGENQLPDKQTIEKTKALLGKLEIDFILIRWPHEDITNTVNRAFAALGSDITLVDSYFGVVRLR